jgi:uncharacterized protein (TIGR03067 family)
MFLSKLKVAAAVVLALCVAVAATAVGARQALADKKETPKDAEKILGTWALVSYEEGGKKAPEELLKNAQVVLTAGGKMTVKNADGKVSELTYKLGPDSKPKEFDCTDDKGRMMFGIYKLDGDTLTVCYDRGGDRPTEFASKPGTSVVLEVLKRQKK